MTDRDVPGVGQPAGPLVRGAELGVWASASEALDAARRTAAEIVAAARDAHEAERRRGFDEGRQDGAEQAACLLAGAAKEASARLDRIEAALPELVLETVAAILGSFDVRDLVAPAVSRALGRLRRGASATIRVAPGGVEPVRAALAGAGGAAICVEPDPALAEGRCVLSSEQGDVELGVEAQIRALRSGLMQHDDGDDPQVLRALAHALTAERRSEQALAAIDRLEALEGAGGRRETLLLRSRALHAAGRREEARACFAAYLSRRAAPPGARDAP